MPWSGFGAPTEVRSERRWRRIRRGTRAENENIAFDWAYVEYKSPIGLFSAGYMNYGSTGTIFGNNSAPQARIKYSYFIVPWRSIRRFRR
jgi:hypothetical protein